MSEIPLIISVDDHVVEPPTLWTDRLPSRYGDRIPHIERDRARFEFAGGTLASNKGAPDGAWCDWWIYDDLQYPFNRLSAAAGFEVHDNVPTTFDEIRPGAWKQADRLADMDANHVQASVCFPNVLPRFCGQAFHERADKELALLCVQAYNDWMIDEWCAGDGAGRLIPLTIVPLWDVQLAAAEVHRCAAKGSFAIAFSENPYPLGLPSFHDADRHWDPLFRACEETGTIINMHIGSSSKMPSTAPDAPLIVTSVLQFQNAVGSMLDLLLSGTFERFPNLVVAYAESQVGWMPYVLQVADNYWKDRPDNSFGSALRCAPSEYVPGHVYGCIFDDQVGLENRHHIGMDQILFEVDYPHADTTFPHTEKVAAELCRAAKLTDEETYKLLRGNAITAFGLQRFGIEA
jgi:predicted TIM-barrel fold metal-dependent hydrolase